MLPSLQYAWERSAWAHRVQRWLDSIDYADWRIRGSVLLLIGLINIGCGAIMYWAVSPSSMTFSRALFRVYAVLLDVPNATVADDSVMGAIVLNLLYLVSTHHASLQASPSRWHEPYGFPAGWIDRLCCSLGNCWRRGGSTGTYHIIGPVLAR